MREIGRGIVERLEVFNCFQRLTIDPTLPANASEVRPWRELPFEVITDLFNSTSIEDDEEQKSRIYKFAKTYYQVFNKDDMKRKFPNFPDHYYDYLSLAAQRRFDTLVKEEKKKWEIDRVDEMSPSGLRCV